MKRAKLILSWIVLVGVLMQGDLQVGSPVHAQEIEDIRAITGLSWSPDGSRIAYSLHSASGSDIWLIDTDGSNVRNLTEGSFYEEGRPVWSPDGNYIAYKGHEGPEDERYGLKGVHLLVVDTEDGNIIDLTSTLDNGGVASFSWSPDSLYLAYTSLFANGKEDTLTAETWIVDMDGTDPVRVLPEIDGVANFHTPQWSPDGQQIAMLSSGFTDNNDVEDGGLWIADIDSDRLIGSVRQLASDIEIMGYTWSPDGNHIAAAAWVSGQSQILVISTVDGSFQMAASAGSDGYFYDLQWSPNGNAVIYVYTTWFGMFSIWRVDIDDEFDPVNLTEEHGDFSSSPVWSPDGGQIAFISRHEGVSNIWIMNADGARLAHITDY